MTYFDTLINGLQKEHQAKTQHKMIAMGLYGILLALIVVTIILI